QAEGLVKESVRPVCWSSLRASLAIEAMASIESEYFMVLGQNTYDDDHLLLEIVTAGNAWQPCYEGVTA
ncbi:MAG: hypothetical protein WKF63_05370, partial [Thermomicrobiales bacterium]